MPEWFAPDRSQRLLMIDMVEGRHGYVLYAFRVLLLESFAAGVVRGVDSPAWQPRRIAVPPAAVVWQ